MFPFLVLSYMAVENTNIKQPNSTIKVNGYDVDRNDFINQVNGQYDQFFNTYKDRWNKNQQQKILEQKKAIINNIQNGNITGVNGNVIDITDAENSGIDQSDLGPGRINIGYITKIGKWMSDGIKQNTPKKTFDNSTLNQAWMNTFFGDSDTPDLQTWIDLDPKDSNGVRGTTGRTDALIQFLNNINVDDYTDFSDALGGKEKIKANLELLKQHLQDGTLNNDDYASAAKLGFNLRTVLSDKIVMPEDQQKTSKQASEQPSVQQPTQYDPFHTSSNNLMQEMKDMISGWNYKNEKDSISLSPLTYTLNKNAWGKEGQDVTARTMARVLSKYGFGNFSKNSDGGEILKKYVNWAVTNVLDKGQWNTFKKQIDKKAGTNQSYGKILSTAIDQYVKINKSDFDKNNRYTIGNTTLYMIGQPNYKTGTAWFYNNDSHTVQKLNLNTEGFLFNLSDGTQMSAAEWAIINSPYRDAYLQATGKVPQNKFGGKFQIGGVITPPEQDPFAIIPKKAPEKKLNKNQAKAKYWEGNHGKEFNNIGEFIHQLTPQDKRELSAAALDVASIVSSVVPVVGGAASVGTGLGSAGLRAYNRFSDGDISLGDIGSTLADTGMAIAGVIPGLGTAAKTAGFVSKMAKTAKIVLPIVGLLGIGTAQAGARRALSDIISGKMPATTDLQDLSTCLTAAAGAVTHYRGSSKATSRLKEASSNGKAAISNVTPDTWTYNYSITDADGKLINKSLTLNNKSEVDQLKKAIKNDDTTELLGIVKRDPTNANVTTDQLHYNKLNKLQKLKTSDSNYGLTYNKGNAEGEITISRYTNPETLQQKAWNRNIAIAEFLDKIRVPKPSFKGIKEYIIGPSRADIIRNAAKPEVTPVRPEATPKETGFDIISHGDVVTPVIPERHYRQTTILSPKTNKTPNDPRFSLLDPRRSRIQDIFLPGRDINRIKLSEFIKDNQSAYNKLANKEKQVINDLITPSLFTPPASEQTRKQVLGIITKMLTPKSGAVWKKDALANTARDLSMIRYQQGGKAWYSGIQDFDPTKYTSDWENQIYAGDTQEGKTWSNAYGNSGAGLGNGRYGTDPNHSYNNSKDYAQSVENQKYYKWFTDQLIKSASGDQKLFKTWANFVDASLPEGSASRFYDNGKLRDQWTIGGKTYEGYNSTGNYNQLADYIKAVRNDNLIANRHNVMRRSGTRYFYKDNTGTIHWVDPETAKKYTIKKDPAAQGYDENSHTYWTDYELEGPTNTISGQEVPEKNKVNVGNIINSAKPAMLGALRAINDTNFNNRQLNNYLSSINPVLYTPYEFNRRVYGDYATMNEMARQGANAQNTAARIANNTADSYLGAATQLEGAAKNQEAVIKGRLADNEKIAQTYEKAIAENKENLNRENQVANQNIKNLNDNTRERMALRLATNLKNHNNWNNWYQGYIEYPAAKKQNEREAMQNYLDYSVITDEAQKNYTQKATEIQNKYRDLWKNASDDEKSVLEQQMTRELQDAKDAAQNEILGKFASLRGLNYTPKTEFTPGGTYVPTYHKKGGEISGASIVVEHLRQRNKDRLQTSWEKQLDRFWRQYGKMKQAKNK